LNYSEKIIFQQKGFLGPILVALAICGVTTQVKSELNVNTLMVVLVKQVILENFESILK